MTRYLLDVLTWKWAEFVVWLEQFKLWLNRCEGCHTRRPDIARGLCGDCREWEEKKEDIRLRLVFKANMKSVLKELGEDNSPPPPAA